MGTFLRLVNNTASSGDTFADDLIGIIMIIIGVIGAVIVPFAIYLAFKLANAPDEQQRAIVKKRFINILASIMIIVILLGLLGIGDGLFDWQGGTGGSANYSVSAPQTIPANNHTNVFVLRNGINIFDHTIDGENPYVVEVSVPSNNAASATINRDGDRWQFVGTSEGSVVITATISLQEGGDLVTVVTATITVEAEVWGPLPPPDDDNPIVSTGLVNPVRFVRQALAVYNNTTTIPQVVLNRGSNHWPLLATGAAVDINHDGHTGANRLAIVASAPGVVVDRRFVQTDDRPGGNDGSTGWTSWGNFVILRHNVMMGGTPAVIYAMYSHLAAQNFNPYTRNLTIGQQVSVGQAIGTMGATGTTGGTTGIHLHFEIRQQSNLFHGQPITSVSGFNNATRVPLRNFFTYTRGVTV